MSTPTVLSSRSVPFALSSDGGVTFKNVVCKKLWGMTLDNAPVEEITDCGPLVAAGTPKVTFNYEFVLNITPNGATEWTADQILNFANDGTPLVVKVAHTTPALYYRSMAGLITNHQEQAPQNGMVTATGTFTGSGTLDTSSA